jgi:uncharacterized protein YoxC
MIFVYIVLGLLAVCAVLVLVIVIQTKRLKKMKAQNDLLAEAVNKAAWELKRLKSLIDETKKVTEEANGKRQELSATPDAGLAGRANALFGGMRDKSSGGNGGD